MFRVANPGTITEARRHGPVFGLGPSGFKGSLGSPRLLHVAHKNKYQNGPLVNGTKDEGPRFALAP